MSELIKMTKNHLRQLVPKASNIEIKIEREHQQYLSKIHIHLPGRVLHAHKRAASVGESLDSTYQAILKQIHKIKSKKQTKGKIRKWIFREPILPPP